MTKREAVDFWQTYILPQVRETYEKGDRPDYPARSEAWGWFTDGLCKDGRITLKQYETWTAPRECGK